MKVAIDISPLSSGHKVRGVGFYLKHLKEALEKYFPEIIYDFFIDDKNISRDIDLVHYPYFEPFFVTLPFLKKKVTVVTVHDLTPLVLSHLFPVGIKGKIKWEVQKRLLRQVDAIITDSESSKRDIVRLAGYAKEKIHVAYLAAGEEFRRIKNQELRIKELRKKYKLPEKFALYVGDVTPNKNLSRLVKACLQTDVPLVMVGKALVATEYDKTNPWNRELEEVQRIAKENPSIIRVGFVESEELVALYNIATVFVMPSLYEGFGLPVIEAMACGCPVITSTKGSLPEVAGDAAVYVDAEDIGSIEKGIQKVFKNPALQKELSQKGLNQSKRFSWKKTAQQTVKVYETV